MASSQLTCCDQLVPGASEQEQSEYPTGWQPQVTMMETFPVPRRTPEWNRVEQRLKESMQNAGVSEIVRIQNRWLWERYAAHKRRLWTKNSGCINEMDAFHGTRGTDPKLIYEGEEGFDMRFAKGSWGQANYFAVSASLCDRYAHLAHDGQKEVFLVSVLIGHTYACLPNSGLRMPPLMPQDATTLFRGQRYDSVTGINRGSQVYMTYDNCKSYPAYIIRYSL